MTHLILQAPNLDASNIEKLAAIAGAGGLQNLGHTAARLLNVDLATRDELAKCCNDLRVDFAYIEHFVRLRDCKVLATDMDSTLINIECIDEIADMAGRKPQVAAITEAAMRGEITDFSESLRRRVALLKGVPIAALERVYQERLQLNPGAENLITAAKAAGLKTMLVSGGFTFFTDRLQQRLGIDTAHANILGIENGVLTGQVLGDIVDAQAKANHLQALAQSVQASAEQIIALGDGANDLKMLALAHYGVAYRAKPIVRAQTPFALNFSGLDAVLNWFRG